MSRKPKLRGRAARLARLFPTGRARAARAPFVLLVVLLLGGGLIGLLVLNSALSEGSFKLDDLQRQTKNLTDEEQGLQRDIDAYSAPDALQRRARELGMVPGGDPAFLNPDGTVKGVPGAAPAGQAAARPAAVLAPETLSPAAAPAQLPAATQSSAAAPSSPRMTAPDVPGAPDAAGALMPPAPQTDPALPEPATVPLAPQTVTTPTPGR
ncbi:septum formation initiator family protein [Streptomyces sp. NPDC006739]|uniref:septum formation initiator family protein n=1 Tax=Streptomyces sp. NPDC006739 TaxID=3364763 RepID=UPI0036C2FC88